LFTLTKHPEYKDLKVISENTYYGDALYSMVSSKRKPRVLIADDNKINAMLIKTILESEYCEIVYTLDGQEALDRLIEGLKSNNPFSIIFADRHMPHLSGSEVIEQYKQLESKYHLPKPTVAVSITGDPSMPDKEKKLYDTIVSKPFNKVELREVFHQAVDEE
ncbi:MAG: response regulator, partial [Campylobacterota bacterium]|nr:response regulator [Campylobacterota bacterium]